MRRTFWILLPLFPALLAPAGAWATSVSQNISVTITVAQPVTFTPSSLPFASQNVGTTSSPQAVTLTNVSGSPLPIYDISARVSVGSAMAYSSDFEHSGSCANPIPINGTCQESVTFTPQSAGTRTAVLQFEATSTSPIYSIPLSGTGTSSSIASAFYVATNGSDSDPGTLAAPFATLTKCQSAMHASGTNKTCYIRAGTYTPAGIAGCVVFTSGDCVVRLTASDSTETFAEYPADGCATAIIDGQSSSNGNGRFTIFSGADSINNLTINCLQMQNFQYAAIQLCGANFCGNAGPDHATISNNIAHHGTQLYTGTVAGQSGINCHNCTNSTISHNVVYDIQTSGFNFTTSGTAGITMSGLSIRGNVVYQTCLGFNDCGGIYLDDCPGGSCAGSTNISIVGNFVRDANPASNTAIADSGIYLDDCTSNATVSQNVMTGKNGMFPFFSHGGTNNLVNGNIIDLAGYAIYNGGWSNPGCSSGTGNTANSNIIIGSGVAGAGGWQGGGRLPPNPSYTANDYYNYFGNAIGSAGVNSLAGVNDGNPQHVNPQFSGCYAIAPSSPAYSSPINFPGITGGWGPPGYVIPKASGSSAPSYPSPTC